MMLFSVLVYLFICFVRVCACLLWYDYPLEAKKPERSSGNQATSYQQQVRFYSSLLPSSVTLIFSLSLSLSLLYTLSALASPSFSFLAVFPFTSQLQGALHPLSLYHLLSILPSS